MDLNVGKWLAPWLASQPGVAAIVGPRIFPVFLPMGQPTPALVYRRVSTQLVTSSAGVSRNLTPLVRLHGLHENDYDVAMSILTAVLEAVKDGVTIRGAGLDFHISSVLPKDSGDEAYDSRDGSGGLFYSPWLDLAVAYLKN